MRIPKQIPFLLLINLLTISLFLGSCNIFTTVKRYRKIEKVIDKGTTNYTVSNPPSDESALPVVMRMSNIKVDPPTEKPSFKSLWDLNNQGQKQLIFTLDQRIKSTDSLLEILQRKYLNDENSINTSDLTKRKVRLTFTITKWHPYTALMDKLPSYSTADRVEYLNYKLTLNDDKVKFTDWNKYITEYGSIDIADLSFQKNISLTGSTGGSFGTTRDQKNGTDENNINDLSHTATITPSLSTTGTLSKTEAQKIKYRYIQLNGSISPKALQLESEGNREIDLSGNVIVEVNMEFTPMPEYLFKFSNFQDAKKNYNVPNLLTFKISKALIPTNSNHNINACLEYKYAYRHVLSGAKTFYEWDDKIDYYTGTVIKKVTLETAEDIIPQFRCIVKTGDDPNDPNNFIKIEGAGKADFLTTNLSFNNIDDVKAFIDWIRNFNCPAADLDKQIIFKDGYSLTYKGSVLTMRILKAIQNQLIDIPEYKVE